MFSTVDTKNGFWHVENDHDSSHLITFNSPFGRFCWSRLPFRFCSAPEEFQQRHNHALDGLNGVWTIHDDILIFGEGSTVEEALTDHDNNLHSLMRRCRKQNMKLHQDKVNLRPKEVPFKGHVSSENGLQADPGQGRAELEMPFTKWWVCYRRRYDNRFTLTALSWTENRPVKIASGTLRGALIQFRLNITAWTRTYTHKTPSQTDLKGTVHTIIFSAA